MKYVILCGGNYPKWTTPRQLLIFDGVPIVEHTVNKLRVAGVDDIAICTNNSLFTPLINRLGIELIQHENSFISAVSGYWVDAFPPIDTPVCYVFGDVLFTQEAINTIVSTPTDSIEFFASAPPFAKGYIKAWAEPFAFKVVDTEFFKRAVETVKYKQDRGEFHRVPIAWELWQVIKGTPINNIDYTNYCVINDYTCDVDNNDDIIRLKGVCDTYGKVYNSCM